MGKGISSSLIISKYKKSTKPGSFQWILNIIFIPISWLIFLIAIPVAIIIGIAGTIQSWFTKKEESTYVDPAPYEAWHIFRGNGKLKIWQRYAGQVRFGPSYYHLKGEPDMPYFKNRIFGDWSFPTRSGMLLQEWTNTKKPETNLIHINEDTFEIEILEQQIPAVIWSAVRTVDGTIQLSCDTGTKIMEYSVTDS